MASRRSGTRDSISWQNGRAVPVYPFGWTQSPESSTKRPFERTMPVYDPRLRVPRANLGDTLIVERIILGYRLEVVSAGPPAANQPPGEPTFTLQPAWHFEGRTADGQARFTIQLPIADGAPTTMLMPTATPLPLPGDSD